MLVPEQYSLPPPFSRITFEKHLQTFPALHQELHSALKGGIKLEKHIITVLKMLTISWEPRTLVHSRLRAAATEAQTRLELEEVAPPSHVAPGRLPH